MSKQAISLSYLYGGKWIGFSDQTKSTMDCLKIKTSSNESFYLQYRTWNKGMNGYYPYEKVLFAKFLTTVLQNKFSRFPDIRL